MTTAYDTWVAAGRPITPAQPIRELVDQLRAAYPAGAGQFGWYADEAHYTADPPLDHTPYSVDGWPLADPHWYVCATDIMVTAVGGLDAAQAIFDRLLASARDGSAPWLKYLIWQGKNYDVRNGWASADADNHYDHIHVSTRTDYLAASLGGWSLIPEVTMLRYLFVNFPDLTSTMPGYGRVHATDGVRYRIEPHGKTFQSAMLAAGAPRVYTVDFKVVGGSYAEAVGVMCGMADHIDGTGNVDTGAILAGVRDALADEAEAGADALRAEPAP